MMVNDKVYGQLTAERAAKVIEEIRKNENGGVA